ncbi:ABC transporter ATP-binding protein [Epilithonimonas lactis]|uniref:ABC transporter domain-containing protein n=1 Tax=Epilithonimonas lactis TaxID=421072 RepID=A0A085BL91_9FLAO|nr:polysaccharide ABC transporter ATP-binding protein [Epilithonimonas lactis]KFC23236.1 hypothetical protein IO89_01190 [Epilithonimonas lactis]SEQ06356.1 ABC transporter [Epilithonimonas lactis]
MNKNIAIKAENISKQYRLGEVGTGTISHDLNRFWARLRGKEDPFLKIGESNDRSQKGESDYVWSLKDINFEIEKGDAVGIIGRNGAGKSTLLKLLSRVTKPTTGHFEVDGRIASLLEVGTGFNPEMTGRENIFLNGAILGMRKHEIKRKFDEIVDFSGVERYIDTPVKRYSSGMYVRLAFAVAAHLESEILIVDEVLAVGDAEFQKKCLGKMGDVSKGEGRTVLFVSHNMGAVQSLCNKGILLENGNLSTLNTMEKVIQNYLHKESESSHQKWSLEKAPGSEQFKILELEILNDKNEHQIDFLSSQEIRIRLTYMNLGDTEPYTHGFNLYNNFDIHILSSHDLTADQLKGNNSNGIFSRTIIIQGGLLSEGNYNFSFAVMKYNPFTVIFHELNLGGFSIVDDLHIEGYEFKIPGIIKQNLNWI